MVVLLSEGWSCGCGVSAVAFAMSGRKLSLVRDRGSSRRGQNRRMQYMRFTVTYASQNVSVDQHCFENAG